jgi:hypothetical protein
LPVSLRVGRQLRRAVHRMFEATRQLAAIRAAEKAPGARCVANHEQRRFRGAWRTAASPVEDRAHADVAMHPEQGLCAFAELVSRRACACALKVSWSRVGKSGRHKPRSGRFCDQAKRDLVPRTQSHVGWGRYRPPEQAPRCAPAFALDTRRIIPPRGKRLRT